MNEDNSKYDTNDEFITYETAKMAAKKGFDWRCHKSFLTNYFITKDVNTAIVTKEKGHYEDSVPWGQKNYMGIDCYYSFRNHDCQPQIVARPTQSMLQRWLREEQDIHITLSPSLTNDGYYFNIYILIYKELFCAYDGETKYSSYEEALEMALQEGLEYAKMSFKDYMVDVKSQLFCNASEEYSSKYITYTHTEKKVDDNIEHFRECHKDGISAYKALLFLNDYITEKK